jgi:hypothetical protein
LTIHGRRALRQHCCPQSFPTIVSNPRPLPTAVQEPKHKRATRLCDPLCFGAAGGIRTPDHLVRSQVLYPTELRPRRSEAIRKIRPCSVVQPDHPRSGVRTVRRHVCWQLLLHCQHFHHPWRSSVFGKASALTQLSYGRAAGADSTVLCGKCVRECPLPVRRGMRTLETDDLGFARAISFRGKLVFRRLCASWHTPCNL